MSVIALMHFRVGETDGVSLEMNKWKQVLEDQGHEVFFISASHYQQHEVITGLDIRSTIHNGIVKNAYDSLDYSAEELQNLIEQEAKAIFHSLQDIIERRRVEYLVVNNISSLGLSLPSAKAVADIAQLGIVKLVYHHHDWYWERDKYSHPTTQYVEGLLSSCFPPTVGRHVVINRIAQHQLFLRKGIQSVVVPNVFDFDQAVWEIDDYNKDMRQRLNIPEHAFVLLQATRIVYRKGIEIAVDIAHKLTQKLSVPVVLVIAGMNEMEEDRFRLLNEHIEQTHVDVRFINHLVGHERDEKTNAYSLWDAYTMCDMVTYPSILEGWGNQLIEALFAEKMVFCYEYPVFKTDISRYNFNLISLGDEYSVRHNGLYQVPDERIDQAVELCLHYLKNQEQLRQDVMVNTAIAKTYFSLTKLSELLLHKVFGIGNSF